MGIIFTIKVIYLGYEEYKGRKGGKRGIITVKVFLSYRSSTA